MNKRELKSIISVQKKFRDLYNRTELIDVGSAGVQVQVEAFPDIAKYAKITVSKRKDARYPWEVRARIKINPNDYGTAFYAVGTERRFIELDIFAIALKQNEL